MELAMDQIYYDGFTIFDCGLPNCSSKEENKRDIIVDIHVLKKTV